MSTTSLRSFGGPEYSIVEDHIILHYIIYYHVLYHMIVYKSYGAP